MRFHIGKCTILAFANFRALQGLTLDVIGQCGMAMKVNCQLDPFDKLLTMVKKTLKRQVW